MYLMYLLISVQFTLPTLLSIMFLCVRGKGRRMVPALSIIFNSTLYMVMMWQTDGQTPAFRLPFEFMNYPYVCIAVLFIGLIVEMVVRATERWWRPALASTDKPPKNSGISIPDMVTFFVVLTSPIGLMDPRLISSLVWFSLILLAASQLQRLKPRWIMITLLVYGCLIFVHLILSLGYNPAFYYWTGFRFSEKTMKSYVFWGNWYSLITHIGFGLALYSLCKRVKDQMMATEGLSTCSINSADEMSACPGGQEVEPSRRCTEKVPVLIDIDVNTQSGEKAEGPYLDVGH